MISHLINRIYNRLGRYQFSHISIFKTVITNFRCFNFKVAIKLPVYIYSNTRIYALGKIVINGPVSRGMIRIGHHPAKAIGATKMLGHGTYIFNGPASFWGGCILENYGLVVCGSGFSMGESCILLCSEKIEFGDKISIGFKNTFMDSSFHFLLDTKRKMTFVNTEPIKIGGGTWITSDCKIMQGASLPPNSVLTANSVLKSDYSEDPQFQMYSGNPAKCIRKNIRRIFNRVEEKRLHNEFISDSNKKFKKIAYEDENQYCLSNSFTFYP